MLRRRFTAAATALLCLAAAATAMGHTDLLETIPADGAVLNSPPRTVTVVYGSPLGGVRSTLVVAGRDEVGGEARLAPRDARRLVIPVDGGTTGRYRAEWVVLAADGHPIEGATEFTVRPPSVGSSLTRAARDIRATSAALRTVR